MKIRTAAEHFDVVVNDTVVGHIDEEGWWPSVFVKDITFKFTPEDLRTIASNIEGYRAYKKSVTPPRWPTLNPSRGRPHN